MEDELGVRERYEYTEYNEVYREWDGEGRMTGYCYDERVILRVLSILTERRRHVPMMRKTD